MSGGLLCSVALSSNCIWPISKRTAFHKGHLFRFHRLVKGLGLYRGIVDWGYIRDN